MITVTDTRQPGLDGLRGLAVLAVVGFHAGLAWIPGGYLGVDAFFVLSGFLITRLLLDEHETSGRVDLGRFWARRLGRLAPALVTVAVVVVAIETVRHHGDLHTLRSDAVSALLYVSNWHFLADGQDYFGQVAAPSLFEHTWSLAIEEQFYLVWPLVILASLRTRRPRFAVGVGAAVGAVASAALMAGLAAGGADPARLYFGTDTRVQAVLLGAVVAAVAPTLDRRLTGSGRGPVVRRAVVHVLAAIGLVGTAVLWWRLDGTSPLLYRGGFSLAALASAAVLPSLALLPAGPLGRVLGLAPLRSLGLISYGVYLWHWPIQLLLTGSATGLRGTPLLALRAVVTLAAAVVSYHLVELPIRQRRPLPRVRLAALSCLVVGSAGLVALLTTQAVTSPTVVADGGMVSAPAATITVPTGVSTSTSVAAPTPASTTLAPGPTTPVTAVPAVAPPPPPPPPPPATTAPRPPSPTYRVSVLGDSVAQSLARGLAPLGPRYGLQVVDDGILGCGIAPVGDYRLAGIESGLAQACVDWEATWAARLQASRPQVALIQVGRHEVMDRRVDGTWTDITQPDLAGHVAAGLDRAIEVASSGGATVVLVTAPYYRTHERPDGGQWPENDPARVQRFNQLVREAAARHPGTTVADLGGYTNPRGAYTSSVDGVRMRRDGVHYSAAACAWFAPWLVPRIRSAASAAPVG